LSVAIGLSGGNMRRTDLVILCAGGSLWPAATTSAQAPAAQSNGTYAIEETYDRFTDQKHVLLSIHIASAEMREDRLDFKATQATLGPLVVTLEAIESRPFPITKSIFAKEPIIFKLDASARVQTSHAALESRMLGDHLDDVLKGELTLDQLCQIAAARKVTLSIFTGHPLAEEHLKGINAFCAAARRIARPAQQRRAVSGMVGRHEVTRPKPPRVASQMDAPQPRWTGPNPRDNAVIDVMGLPLGAGLAPDVLDPR
jgi:hypothetical protein